MQRKTPSFAIRDHEYSLWLIPILVLITLEIFGAFRSGVENLVSEVAAIALTSLAVLLALRNAFSQRGAVKLFWLYLSLGCGLWTVHLFSRAAEPFGPFVHQPGSDLSDIALFLHLIFFTSALLLPAIVRRSYFNLKHHLIDLVLLFSFWIVIYAYFVAPFDFVVPNTAVYDFRLQMLNLIQGFNLVVLAGLVAFRAEGIWAFRYKTIFIASSLYTISLAVPMLPGWPLQIASSIPFLIEQASALCFVWIGIRALREDKNAEDLAANSVRFNPIAGLVITVVLVVAGFLDTLRQGVPHALLAYRLNVILAAALVFVPVLVREVMQRKEQRVRDAREWLRQAKVEMELSLSRARYNELVETVPALVWRIDAKSRRLQFINRQLQQVLGFSPHDWTQKQPKAWFRQIERADRKEVLRWITTATPNEPVEIDHRMITADGSQIWLKSTVRVVPQHEAPSQVVGVSIDITQQKKAELSLILSENALRTSEKKQRLFVEQTFLGMIEWDEEFRVREWNNAASEIFGFQTHEVLGKHPFDFLIPEDPREPLEKAFDELTRNPSVILSKSGHFRKDGRRIYCQWFNTPVLQHGRVLGVVSFVRDVTEQTLAEQAHREFGARLLDAQEKERRKIARELHDDIGQELAILCMRISAAPEGNKDLRRKAEEIVQKVSKLSHQLHSAQLDLLGLDAALRNACREAGQEGKSAIVYTSNKVPQKMASDIAICFYRVAQEALHNANKHSGAEHISVELSHEHDELLLTIMDDGCGFDPQLSTGPGLGLTSMNERMRGAGGELIITSAPGDGTRIMARAPLAISKAQGTA